MNQPRQLTARAQFLRVNGGKRAPAPGFVLLMRPRDDGDPAMGIGYTMSRKVGGAVERNRLKRRFRALVRVLLPTHGIPGADHVLIGRTAGIERPFAQLGEELRRALVKVSQ